MWEDKKIEDFDMAKLPPLEDMSTPAQLLAPKYTWTLDVVADYTFYRQDHRVPNWFHRKMQELILGFKWQKL